MLSVKVSSRHQIVVPAEVRRKLGIKAGDRLAVKVHDRAIVLRPSGSAVDRLYGAGQGLYGPDPVAYVRALRDEWEERLERMGR
ncbi:MAG: AbrB/MazE/SpoVT family DNA-binding domain-containing protein [Candidatus Limnocylindria bacterium]